MEAERRLYRSRDALIGGVCAGIARYFEADSVAIRILAVVLSLATGGLVALAYLVLWAVLPREPERPAPFEVAPQSAHSETYGDIDCAHTHRATDDAAAAAAARIAAYGAYRGVGHVPPVPPVAARVSGVSGEGALRNDSAVPGFSYAVAGVAVPSEPDENGIAAGVPESTRLTSAPFGESASASAISAPASSSAQTISTDGMVAPARPAASDPDGGERGLLVAKPAAPGGSAASSGNRGARVGVAFGILLLFFGVLALVGTFVMGVTWWQFWPLALVIAGITQMAIPGEQGHRASRISGGFVVFCLGAALLPMSLGVLSFETVAIATANLWPLLVIMAGFFVLGGVSKSPLFPLLTAVAFAAFCVAGLVCFSVPGPTESLTIETPFGREYVWGFR